MNVISDPQAAPLPEAERGFTIDLRHGLGFVARNRMAISDIARGLSLWRLALTLSWLDIRLRYRGSVLGPLWLTLSTAVMVAALGFLYAVLFHTTIRDYLPFLALSLVLWSFIAAMVSDACTSFTQAENMIRSMRIPFSLYIGQIVARNVLILGHNVIVIVVVFVAFQVPVNLNALAAIPAFLLWLVDGAAASLLFGALCARFRDIPPIVGSVMQIAFYVSAVMWKPDFLHGHQSFLVYDPFYTILQIVRGPLLGQIPTMHAYISALGFSAVLCIFAWLTFLRVRHRIAFWI
ncbi:MULTISPECIES: ABC transporter permease [unclassified Acidisoma]|jgi:lipopolysaccharide transport system permease protein|uniref:ABC transporter permease n=1 Tax=unclassified Acidisoma TaxID=2634065 RepID=UPI00131E879F|nr:MULTISPECIES: ABC transporter permease [unclassified Acidisoma]